MTFSAIDLFCGAGGFSAGLVTSGFEVVGALDSWKPAAETYRANFDHPLVQGDVRDVNARDLSTKLGALSSVDLVVGGPPCQGFSIQRIGNDSDDRNDLIFEFARLVIELRPRMFIMENVPGLLGKRGKVLVTRFEKTLRKGGYDLHIQRIDAVDFGVPQYRRRVLFLGWLSAEVPSFRLHRPPTSDARARTVWEAIGDLPQPAETRLAAPDPLHWRTKLSPINVERLGHIPPGSGFESLPVSLRVNAHKAGAHRIGHRNVYGRLHPDRPAGTITAKFDSFTRGKFAHPFEDRNITLREGARLQTFADSHRFRGTQEEMTALIGNAVPPVLAEAIGIQVAAHLTNTVPFDPVQLARGSGEMQLELLVRDCGSN